MKRFVIMLSVLALMAAPAFAHHKDGHTKGPKFDNRLDVAQNLVCSIVGDEVQATWDLVDGASVYAVEFDAAYDIAGDGEADASLEFEFETPNTFVAVPLASLVLPLDTTGDGADDTFLGPIGVEAKVKAKNPGEGPQNHPHSAKVECVAL